MAAAEVLREELGRPGGYHRRRARGVIERPTGLTLGGGAGDGAGAVGAIYGMASGVLHGRAAGPEAVLDLYTELLGAARELLVPLPERAARILELTALPQPCAAEAAELARWADPRAIDHFFRSAPAPVWLGVLAEHAPHLLMPDRSAGGRWPTVLFLDHVAATDPDAIRAWLTAPADQVPATVRAQQIALCGRPALEALLGLALAPGRAVGPGRSAGGPDTRLDPGGGGAAGRCGRGRARRPPVAAGRRRVCGRRRDRRGTGPDGGSGRGPGGDGGRPGSRGEAAGADRRCRRHGSRVPLARAAILGALSDGHVEAGSWCPFPPTQYSAVSRSRAIQPSAC